MPPRILIVEDEAIISGDLNSRLTTMGYEVAGIADNGPEAVRMAKEAKAQALAQAQSQPLVNLVLMDVVLKGPIDGLQTAREIKTDCDLPIIFLTSYSDMQKLNQARVTEPFGYILKPYSERELQVCIEMALYKHRAESKFRKIARWLTAAVASNGDGVIFSDLQGKIVFLNRTAERLTGWSLDDALGRPFFEVFHVTHKGRDQVADDYLDKMFQEGGSIHLAEDWVLKSKNGQDIVIDDTAAPVWTQDEQTIGGVIVFRDATTRVALESGLRHTAALKSLGQLVASLDEVQY